MNKYWKLIKEKYKQFSAEFLVRISGKPIDNTSRPPIRRDVKFGIIIIAVFFGLFWLWALLAPLESAALAPGKIVASSNRKTIQHLEGGIIRKIYVKEGSSVKAGDPLIKLDDTQARARYELLWNQVMELYAKEARLIAQRDNKDQIKFPDVLMKNRQRPDIKQILLVQSSIFMHDKETFEHNMKILENRIEQLNDQIMGFKHQVHANEKQYEFIQKELDAMKALEKKAYVEKPRLWALEREAAKLMGNKGELMASIAEAQQKIGETKQQMIAIKNETRKEVLDELTATQRNLTDSLSHLTATEDVLKRTIITAPQNGKVVNLKEHTVSGVVGAGKDIMDIVPSDDALVVEARISPLDIDVVHKGMMAKIKLIAYKQRSMPSVDGVVTEVSADSFYDAQTNNSYYIARIDISAEQLKKLAGVKLHPGMPVEVMIIVDRRTAWQYLITPIRESYNKAFREQ